ncbi:MAG TPA: helix-turn-helix domain-containing protein [Nitrospira sp.]|nr:helix-turn-helix domain-containing protein [Nitrospira sp.]
MEPTQRERVLKRLIEEGEVDNFWAFHSYILRLGAIIHGLRKEGYTIESVYGKERGYARPFWKNCYYILKSKPHVDVF